VVGNAEFCNILLAQGRDADCGVPLCSALELGLGKRAKVVKTQ